jgi:hypothetical protein
VGGVAEGAIKKTDNWFIKACKPIVSRAAGMLFDFAGLSLILLDYR